MHITIYLGGNSKIAFCNKITTKFCNVGRIEIRKMTPDRDTDHKKPVVSSLINLCGKLIGY